MSVMDGAIVNEKFTPACQKHEVDAAKRQTSNPAPHAQSPFGVDPVDTRLGRMDYATVSSPATQGGERCTCTSGTPTRIPTPISTHTRIRTSCAFMRASPTAIQCLRRPPRKEPAGWLGSPWLREWRTGGSTNRCVPPFHTVLAGVDASCVNQSRWVVVGGEIGLGIGCNLSL